MARLRSRHLAVLIASVLAAGCGGGGGSGPPPGNMTTTISKTSAGSGDAQNGTVGQPLASPLQVAVTEDGQPAAGVTVSWATTAAGGSMAPPSGPTNADGVGSSLWSLGTASGAQTASATVTGAAGSPVTFTATAAAGSAATLAKAGGDGQTAEIGTQLALPVQARVTDEHGNGVAGTTVAWGATGGTVSSAAVPSVASGLSSVTVTAGVTAGPISITAASDGLIGSPLTFTATATTAPTTGSVSVTNNAFSPTAITVAAGTTVTWTWSSAARQHNVTPDGTVPGRSGNPVDGPTTYLFRFDIPGSYRYYCEVHGGPGGGGMSGIITVQ